jgi:hypothetical protein
LMELGVSLEALQNALRAGHLARLNCTDNDPPFIPGTEAWRFVVRTLREELLKLGWHKSDPGNYSIVTNEDRKLNIVVATGDALTCRYPGTPRTKSIKGLFTEAATIRNAAEGDLFPETLSEEHRRAALLLEHPTYIILICITDEGYRGELSYPDVMDEGQVISWRERIFIPNNDESPYSIERPEDGPDTSIDVPVRRKA